MLSQVSFNPKLEPQMPEDGMTGWRSQYHRVNILSKDDFLTVFSVKEEYKVDFGLGFGDPLQGLKCKPANTIQLWRNDSFWWLPKADKAKKTK